MGIIAWYTDPRGRRCPVYRPADLQQLELDHSEFCEADEPECPEGPMGAAMTILKHDDAVRLYREDGGYLETSGAALSKQAAAREVDRMVQLYLRDYPRADYAEGMRKVLQAQPTLARQYAGLGGPSLEADLRRLGPDVQEVIVDDGGAARHIHRDRKYGSVGRSDLLGVQADGAVRISWAYSPLVGDQVPTRVTFSKTRFSHKGLAEAWLRERALIASAWTETFAEFIAELPDAGQQRAVGDRVLARAAVRALAQAGGGDVKEQLRDLIRGKQEHAPEEVLLQALEDQTTRQSLIPLLLEFLDLE